MAEPYRFGGPIPVSAGRLKYRRELRASRMYADLKRIRRERAEEERAVQHEHEHDAKTGVVRVHLLSSDEPINLDLQKEQAKTALAPFKRHDAPAIPGLLPLCAWRIEGQDFSRPGFTTDFEQVKFWVRRGAVVTPLHQPSEHGKFRTVSGAVVARLAELPTDPWGCPLPESASTARDSTSDTRAAIDRVAQQLKAVRDTHPEAAPESQSSPLVSSNPPDRETNAAPLPGLQRLEPPAPDSAR